MKPLEAIYFRDFSNAHIPEIMEEIWIKEIYKPYLGASKHANLIIVDVGANIGLFSYYASPYAKRIIALEPSTMHQETLKNMLTYNTITNVEVLPYGLSNKCDTKKFYLSENTTAFSLTQLDPSYPTETIEVIDMDKLFELTKIDHIDLLKLDPEGEESKIITSEAFKNCVDKIKVIVGEYHQWTDMNQGQFQKTFEELGYTFNWIMNMKASCYTAVRL